MFADTEGKTKALACLIKSPEFCKAIVPYIKSSYFDGVIDHNLAKMAKEYFEIYGTTITEYALSSILVDKIKSKAIKGGKDVAMEHAKRFKDLSKIDISDWAFVRDNMILMIKNAEWKVFVEEIVTKRLPRDDFAAIERRAAEISSIAVGSDVEPYEIYHDKAIDERYARREHEYLYRETGISTGIKRLDEALYKGGWFKKNFYLIMAPPKRGKSNSLYWFAYMANVADIDVALFSCENGREVIDDRFDAMISETLLTGMSINFKEVARKVRRKRPPGKLYVFEYPTVTLTCAEVERQVEKINSSSDRQIGLIIVDYLDIMKPMQKRDDRLIEEADIGKGLRALGGKFVVPVLSATQVNRSGSDKAIITGRDVRGTWDKIADADCVITLSGTAEDLIAGRIKIHIAESRNSASITITISTKYNMGRFYGETIREEI